MWNFFKKEPKKSIKKRSVKKVKKKPVSQKNKVSDPLDMLDRTLDKKLKEMQEHKKSSINTEKKISLKNDAQSTLDKISHTDKLANINFTNKTKTTSNNKNIIATTNKKKTNQVDYSHFVKALKDSIEDIDSGVLYAGLTDMKTKKNLYQFSTKSYKIHEFNFFIKQVMNTNKNDLLKEKFLLIDLEKNNLLYLHIFNQHYFIMLFDKNEVSLGQVLNIIKPELVKNYHNTQYK